MTGGLGSGKSTVGGLLRRRGFAVLDADEVYRDLLQRDEAMQTAIVERLGEGVLGEDGRVSRGRLRRMVFEEPATLRMLGGVTHPFVCARLDAAVECYRSGRPLDELDPVVELPDGERRDDVFFLSVPLLYETGIDALCDGVAVVYAPFETRLVRLESRSGLGRRECEVLEGFQMPLERKRELADWVIDNSSDLERLRARVEAFLAELDEWTESRFPLT